MALRLDKTPQVWGITGNLGGGKTLTAVNIAVNAMTRGYYIVSNVTLKLDVLERIYGSAVRELYHHFSFDDPDFDPFKLPTGSPRGSGGDKRVLVILDECAEWVDQYSSAKDPRIQRFWSWLRHSSKRSQDVLLIVQRLEYLNKVLRLLISKWVVVDDLAVWRIPVIKMRVPFGSGWVMQRVFDRNKRLVQGPCLCKKASWGRFYDTAECLNSDGACYNTSYHGLVIQPKIGLLLFAAIGSSLALLITIIYLQSRQVARAPRAVSARLAAIGAPAAEGPVPPRSGAAAAHARPPPYRAR